MASDAITKGHSNKTSVSVLPPKTATRIRNNVHRKTWLVMRKKVITEFQVTLFPYLLITVKAMSEQVRDILLSINGALYWTKTEKVIWFSGFSCLSVHLKNNNKTTESNRTGWFSSRRLHRMSKLTHPSNLLVFFLKPNLPFSKHLSCSSAVRLQTVCHIPATSPLF